MEYLARMGLSAPDFPNYSQEIDGKYRVGWTAAADPMNRRIACFPMDVDDEISGADVVFEELMPNTRIHCGTVEGDVIDAFVIG